MKTLICFFLGVLLWIIGTWKDVRSLQRKIQIDDRRLEIMRIRYVKYLKKHAQKADQLSKRLLNL